MRKVIIWSLVAAAVVTWLSWYLLPSSPSNTVGAFASGFGVNLAAGFVGGAVSLLIGAVLARHYARGRVEALGTPIASFVRQMRVDGKFSPEAARAAVIVAVSAASDEKLGGRGTSKVIVDEEPCEVCSLPYDVLELPGNERACAHCGLRGNVWCLPPQARRADDSSNRGEGHEALGEGAAERIVAADAVAHASAPGSVTPTRPPRT